MNYINSKAKATLVYLFSIIALGIFVLSTKFAVWLCSGRNGLMIGVLLMILAIPMHIAARKKSFAYILSFTLNFIGCGFSVSAYYLSKGISLRIISLLIAILPSLVILTLVYLIFKVFSKTKKIAITSAIILNTLFLFLTIAIWINSNVVLGSFCFFSLLISLFFLGVFGVTINHDERSVLRDISYGSFGAFVILTVVVIVVLSQGEALDSLDLGVGGNKKNKQIKSK